MAKLSVTAPAVSPELDEQQHCELARFFQTCSDLNDWRSDELNDLAIEESCFFRTHDLLREDRRETKAERLEEHKKRFKQEQHEYVRILREDREALHELGIWKGVTKRVIKATLSTKLAVEVLSRKWPMPEPT